MTMTKEQARVVRRKRSEAGLCVRCGRVPPEPGLINCRACLDRIKGYRERWGKAGLCNQCGRKPARLEGPTCPGCFTKGHEAYLKLKVEGRHLVLARRAAGLCEGCGGPIPPGTYQGKPNRTCPSCREHRRGLCLAHRVRGPRYAAMERDGFRCQLCGSTRSLLIHHRNGNGDTSGSPDDRIENLITLCNNCHSPLTYLRRSAVDREFAVSLLLA